MTHPSSSCVAPKGASQFGRKRHWPAAGLFIVAAFALLGMPAARAAIVYSGLKNFVVSSQGSSLFINLDTGAFSTTGEFAGYQLSFYYMIYGGNTPQLTFTSPAGNGIEGDFVDLGTSTDFDPAKLGPGALVSGTKSFHDYGYLGASATFGKAGHGFVGLRLHSAAGKTLYGWAYLVIDASLQTTVVDYAYENDGVPILTGATGETTLAVQVKIGEVTAGAAAKVKLVRQGDLSIPLTVHYTVDANSRPCLGRLRSRPARPPPSCSSTPFRTTLTRFNTSFC